MTFKVNSIVYLFRQSLPLYFLLLPKNLYVKLKYKQNIYKSKQVLI